MKVELLTTGLESLKLAWRVEGSDYLPDVRTELCRLHRQLSLCPRRDLLRRRLWRQRDRGHLGSIAVQHVSPNPRDCAAEQCD